MEMERNTYRDRWKVREKELTFQPRTSLNSGQLYQIGILLKIINTIRDTVVSKNFFTNSIPGSHFKNFLDSFKTPKYIQIKSKRRFLNLKKNSFKTSSIVTFLFLTLACYFLSFMPPSSVNYWYMYGR